MVAAEEGVVSFEEACALHPECEVLHVCYRVPTEAFPGGFECLLLVPKAKLREARDRGAKPPFWRHGETIEITPTASPSGGDLFGRGA